MLHMRFPRLLHSLPPLHASLPLPAGARLLMPAQPVLLLALGGAVRSPLARPTQLHLQALPAAARAGPVVGRVVEHIPCGRGGAGEGGRAVAGLVRPGPETGAADSPAATQGVYRQHVLLQPRPTGTTSKHMRRAAPRHASRPPLPRRHPYSPSRTAGTDARVRSAPSTSCIRRRLSLRFSRLPLGSQGFTWRSPSSRSATTPSSLCRRHTQIGIFLVKNQGFL